MRGLPPSPKLPLQHILHTQHPGQLTDLPLSPPHPTPLRLPIEDPAHSHAFARTRHPPLIVKPRWATTPKGAFIGKREEVQVCRRKRVVKPDCYEAGREEEEEGVYEGIIFAHKYLKGDVVVVVGVEYMSPPLDRLRRAAKERYL